MYDFLSDFFNSFEEILPSSSMYHEEKTCPVCHRTYRDFQKSGKLGCGACYEAFRIPITATLRQIHSNTVHTGKVPSRCSGELKRQRLYEALKKQLSDAVKNENYEEAARLHKEIRNMESEGK